VLFIELLHEYSYTQHGLVAHRYKFPSCQSKSLVCFGNDEEQTALKWQWCTYPVASPGRETHCLSLKQSDNVIMKMFSWMSAILHLPGQKHMWFCEQSAKHKQSAENSAPSKYAVCSLIGN
jgi:hypothetical protein